MKKLYLLALIAWCVVSGKAQSFQSDTIGFKMDRDSSVIMGECIEFPCWIQSVEADSTGTFLLVQGRDLNKKETGVKNSGDIWMILLPEKKVLWQRPINYFVQQARLTDQGVSFVSKDKYFLLDLRTGKEIWTGKKMIPYSMNAEDNILLAYKGSTMNGISKQLQGYDMLTGALLWKRELSHQYGWNESLMLDDSTRLIVSDGLHTVRLSDGTGNDFPMRTGVDDYRSAAAIGALGIVAGVLTGTGFFPYGNNVVVELVSNVLADDSLLYVASKEQLLCLDRQLKMKWGYPIPEDAGSCSRIFIKGDRLYMINYGYGYRDNLRNHSYSYAQSKLRAKIGRPFMASFDKKSGKNLCFHFLSDEKEMVEDSWFDTDNECVVLSFADRISRIPFDADSVEEHRWDTGTNGKIIRLLKRPFVLKDTDGSGFREYNLTVGNPAFFLYTDKNEIFETDQSLHVRRSFPIGELGLFERLGNGYSIVDYRGMAFLLDSRGMEKARLRISSDRFVIGDKTYAFSLDRKTIIELSDVKKDEEEHSERTM